MDIKIKDVTGKKFGRLTVLSYSHTTKRRSYWNCKCDCGNECLRSLDNLHDRSSCGCIRKESYKNAKSKDLTGCKFGSLTALCIDTEKKEATKRIYWKCLCNDCGKEVSIRSDILTSTKNPIQSCGCKRINHGDSKTRFYKIFNDMKQRCSNPNCERYSSYGGRGIKVEWESYEDFKKDMYDSYLEHSKKYGEIDTTIERIDVNKNYCKSNCKWVTWKEQSYNKSNTIFVEMEDGSKKPLALLSEELNISYGSLYDRYYNSKYSGTRIIPYKELIKDEDIV